MIQRINKQLAGAEETLRQPMCVLGTPVTRHQKLNLWVKREELCCPGGPNFSKTRGVFAHIKTRPEYFIGVLDTRHSQGGWAVARACKILGKQCVDFYPVLKGGNPAGGFVQEMCRDLGSNLLPLKAGRSAVLYHQAKKLLYPDGDRSAYMMPNALKLPEMVDETAAEVARTKIPNVDLVLVSASSGTIAAGVIRGLRANGWDGHVVVHMGYSRPTSSVRKYIERMAAIPFGGIGLVDIIDEGYAYADEARAGMDPSFACNSYYDLKAFRWWVNPNREHYKGARALLWNIG